ncbi:MAG: hypothetical protein IE909_15700 [Campylobacterales bacterium]|nr:hypothetical protein [Campylobacterales bacterium]
MNRVFISGSISIKKLPVAVEASLDNIFKKGMEILVGDADGIDTMVQNYCKRANYRKVTVYSIYPTPRYMVNGFNKKYIIPKSDSKRERDLQKEKDEAMTLDSEYSFVIWDGKSKGSFSNVVRALENNKKIKLYLSDIDDYMQQSKITKTEIEFVYRKNNGYSAAEVVEYLKREGENVFQHTRAFNKALIDHKVIKKEDGVYVPMPEYKELFMIDKNRGKVTGIRFKNEFINWVEKWVKKIRPPEEQSLF